ncbi:Hypothetical predicted protein [Mytilus galloprovincialis]|uniref:Uncharacterized protein n=1 Tax=Mytilus galloprovincialis TaxID=29158 RepID=A0A8B6C112_MYTGA|nr:Hypothetical predicted protein [Mytilus galloprovincialis]
MTGDLLMDNTFDFDNSGLKFSAKYKFPQLCTKCGQYSGERHKYCLVCVDKMRRHPSSDKLEDDSFVGIFSSRTPRKRPPQSFRFGHTLANNLCTVCKSDEKQFHSTLCLKCDANRRELSKSRDTSYSLHSFGSEDLILALSQSSSSLVGFGRKADVKCIVCRKHIVLEKNGMLCKKCLAKSKNHAPVGRFFKEIERITKEAASVKEEFLNMEPVRGSIQWEISFNARRESLKHLLNSIVIMRSKNRDEKNKQDDAIYYIKTLIEECTIHFEKLRFRVDKTGNTLITFHT